MGDFIRINENICRFTVPYKDIFTTLYTVRTPEGVLLFDAASWDSDAQDYTLPFLKAAGVSPEELRYIFISHNHTDHAGGLKALITHFPHATILSRSPKLHEAYSQYHCHRHEDGERIMDVLQVVTIVGHTKDCSAILDTRTKTLISGDCLQSYGIRGSGTWAANITYPDEYVKAIAKVRALDIDCIVTAHDYDPQGYRADGKAAVSANLDACLVPLKTMQQLILRYPELDDAGVQAKFNYDPRLPKVSARVIGAMRLAMEEKRIELL